jgi:hypothetical protein
VDSKEEIEEQVKRALDYLIAEGMVVEEDGLYRMKTPEEQEEELEALLRD